MQFQPNFCKISLIIQPKFCIILSKGKRFENKSLLALKEKYKHLEIELFIVSPKTFNVETKYNVPIYMVPFI